jgi:hypothetical protein
MRINGALNKKPVTIAITILVASPTKIYIRAYDKDFPKTLYTDRFGQIKNEETFYIRMPISPQNIVVEISKNPYFDSMGDSGFKVLDAKRIPLKKKLSAFNSASPVIRNYIAFCQEFCQRASYISAKGSIYTSNDGQFQIDYLDDIRDENGMVLNTPARINKSTAVIQVSKNKFDQYTVPMRMAILLHEFSHYYLNGNIADETEADLNALLIYLGLGYPRIDAYNVFTKVFEHSNNDENIKRMKIIDEFIRNFERKYVDMTYDSGSLYENYL